MVGSARTIPCSRPSAWGPLSSASSISTSSASPANWSPSAAAAPALNVVVGGDELLGLKRGLLYAGAQGVLLTLWDVNDQSTADFMKIFYEQLQRNPNKALAAQYAMQEIRKLCPHPFYWAPFVLVGKYE